MRAMRADRPGPIESNPLAPVDVPVPEPGSGQIRVRVSVCGICLTDLHELEQDLPWKGPVVPGHQVVGVVDALGPGVDRLSPGDRVGLAWLGRTCGKCRFCVTGRENLCEAAEFTGYDFPGGYAEYALGHQQFAYRLPGELNEIQTAPLLCAGIIGYRALRLSGAQSGLRLGLYGFGASAHIAIQIARHRSSEVYVFTRSQEHQKLAEQLGAAWVGRAEDTPPHKLDASIVFAPAGPLVREALRVTDRGGTVALAGIHMSPTPELDYRDHLYWERCLRSVANNTREDGEELLRAAAEIPVRTHTQTYPLSEANQALQDLKTCRIDGAGVLLIG
ncbi:MAG: zinc-dependent alcohol dehydrogenase family protein [Phycisphaerales bacterium]|nr:MAG: zinc-dependent alcohol dehydrogenase family protein [Phycisphaerales bacterium]